ncbi:MAG: enoyl-CoA hydratase/isomerase family protein [Niabella sp.]|nr:enoyl-CoA hydratase/isomerase family protein [Niabella sp.]
MNYTTIEIDQQPPIATIWLNRPEVRNAFNETMIAELTGAFTTLSALEGVRVILLRGRGTIFCAGADLNWMKQAAQYSYEQNLKESGQLAQCFKTIYDSPKPTIAVVQGAAMGGANGLLAACDFAYATDETVLAFSEVKIGLIPATIAPYILKRIGESKTRELMLTGKKIKGVEAARLGLVNQSAPEAALDVLVETTISELLTAGPASVAQCKTLLAELSAKPLEAAVPYTTEMIAQARVSPEGQEGMKAFLEKRKPDWIK